MGTIEDALKWSDSNPTMSLFLVLASEVAPQLKLSSGLCRPKKVRVYELEDEARVLPGRRVFEYDVVVERLPADLDGYLTCCLQEGIGAGAEVAWFGFEGSFHFDHLLTEDIAAQVYAVADGTGLAVSGDRELASTTWKERVAQAGNRLRRVAAASG